MPRCFPEGLLKSATAFNEQGVAGGKQRMDPTPESKLEKPEKSYLSAAVESISPWGGSRSSTPKPPATAAEGSGLKNQQGGDHTTQSWKHGLSSKRYPPDCPPLTARWFYAVDVEFATLVWLWISLISDIDSQTKTQVAKESPGGNKACATAQKVCNVLRTRFPFN